MFFVLVGGRGECFGVQLKPKQLYSIKLNQRFVLQCFTELQICLLTNLDCIDVLFKTQDLNTRTKVGNFAVTKELNFSILKTKICFDLNCKFDESLLKSIVELKNVDSKSKIPNKQFRLYCSVQNYQRKPVSGSESRKITWTYQSYVNFANDLNRLRSTLHKLNKQGPNVMIVGPCDSGKSTLVKLLVNYALQQHWKPLVVDLDVGQGSIGLPGMIGTRFFPVDLYFIKLILIFKELELLNVNVSMKKHFHSVLDIHKLFIMAVLPLIPIGSCSIFH